MGLSTGTLDLIFREHLHKPLPKAIHTIGRQVILADLDAVLALFKHLGMTPKPCEIIYDDYTLEAKRDFAATGKRYLSDTTVFAMLGVEEIVTIDVSDYEKAGVVVDLMSPLADEYDGIADFIIGGSTLDNVFDPALYLMNINRLLRPGGRLFEIDCAVNGFGFVAYLIFTAAWFLDYFVVNKFDDCKVYLIEIPGFWYLYGFGVNPNVLINGSWIENFPNRPGCQLWIAVIAEKGEHSTYSLRPNQAQYRAKEEWQPYFESLKHIAANSRQWVRGSAPTPGEIAHTPPQGRQIGYDFLGTLFCG